MWIRTRVTEFYNQFTKLSKLPDAKFKVDHTKANGRDFHASDGWLERWKKRYNTSFQVVSGANACTSKMVAPWEETMLPTI